MEIKKCIKCEVEKEVCSDNFYRNKTNKNGFHGECKVCMLKTRKKYQQTNKTKNRETSLKYYNKNKSKINKKRKIYRQENKAEINEKQKMYYQDNKNKIKEKQKQYRRQKTTEIKGVKTMDKQAILANLCAYDLKNPDNVIFEDIGISVDDKKEPCFCDNCFYGRTKLAEYTLELLEQIDDYKIEVDDLTNQLANEGIY